MALRTKRKNKTSPPPGPCRFFQNPFITYKTAGLFDSFKTPQSVANKPCIINMNSFPFLIPPACSRRFPTTPPRNLEPVRFRKSRRRPQRKGKRKKIFFLVDYRVSFYYLTLLKGAKSNAPLDRSWSLGNPQIVSCALREGFPMIYCYFCCCCGLKVSSSHPEGRRVAKRKKQELVVTISPGGERPNPSHLPNLVITSSIW